MVKLQLLLPLLAFCLVSCQAVVDRMAGDIADQASEQVVEQVNTAVAGASLSEPVGDGSAGEEIAQVTRVIDGDTIDVLLDGRRTRIRYLQMNTPERDEPCYREATQANAKLVAGKNVQLVADRENADRYGRLLRFVYADGTLVNRALVKEGYAEVVLYPPNDAHYHEYLALERAAAQAGLGCHPTGIFDDGSTRR